MAGLLARKAGVVHLHLGDGERGLEMVRRLLRETELPPRVFHPTHTNRRKALFEEACEISRRGVTIDVTAFPVEEGEDAWSAADAWSLFHEQGGDPSRLTISSDGGGCLPVFNDQGELTKFDFATSKGLVDTVQDLMRRGYALAEILPSMTSNVAGLMRLPGKGRISAGLDADLSILDDNGGVSHVMANGRWMVQDGAPVVKGTFE